MALTLAIETTEQVELEECVESIAKQVDADDFDSLVESAVSLKKLANNRHFLAAHVNDRLAQCHDNSSADAGDTSFLLARQKRIWIRANIWIPPAMLPMNKLLRASVSAYLIPHDHRFSFVTVGYLGGGYETTIFEYDSNSISGYPGEQVELRFLEKTQLETGKVMVYRAGRDVHCQAHPREFSISLNLLTFGREYCDQYTFDVKRSIITGRAQDFRRAQAVMCQVASRLGNGRTANLLEQVSRQHDDAEIRLCAFEAWSRLEKSQTVEVWKNAMKDRSPFIRKRALNELARLA
jgi:hypothetical protein